jgi:hypothetical protein
MNRKILKIVLCTWLGLFINVTAAYAQVPRCGGSDGRWVEKGEYLATPYLEKVYVRDGTRLWCYLVGGKDTVRVVGIATDKGYPYFAVEIGQRFSYSRRGYIMYYRNLRDQRTDWPCMRAGDGCVVALKRIN